MKLLKRASILKRVTTSQSNNVEYSTNAEQVRQDIEQVTEAVKKLKVAVDELVDSLQTLETVSLKIGIEFKED